MPKQSKGTQILRDRQFIKTYIKNGCKVGKTAKELGITHVGASYRLADVQKRDTYREFLESDALKETLHKVAKAGLEAEEEKLVVDKDGKVHMAKKPDWHARHKFWKDLNIITGYIKDNGYGTTVNQLNIFAGLKQVDTETIRGLIESLRAGASGEGSVLIDSGRTPNGEDEAGNINPFQAKQGTETLAIENKRIVGSEQADKDIDFKGKTDGDVNTG